MSDITDAGPRLKAMNDVLAENDRLRLTEAERGAMESVLDFCERTDKPLPTSDQIATLRGLLERTLTHANPDDGSVQESVT